MGGVRVTGRVGLRFTVGVVVLLLSKNLLVDFENREATLSRPGLRRVFVS